jgi:hypothetical protein
MEFKVDVLADSYSIVGDKSLTFSDGSDFILRFIDTGGVFGSPKDLKVKPSDFAKSTRSLVLTFADNSDGSIFSRVDFEDGYVTYSTSHSDSILLQWFKYAEPSRYSTLFLPAEISSQEATRFMNVYTQTDRPDAGRDDHGNELWGSGYTSINNQLNESLRKANLLPISIYRNKETLTVSVMYLGSQNISINSLPIDVEGNKVKCSTKILVGDIKLNGFTLLFPNPELATEYVSKLGLKSCGDQSSDGELKLESPKGLVSQIGVSGIIEGKQIQHSGCDAELRADTLHLFSPGTTTPIVSFSLNNPELAIDGTSEAFIISDKPETIIRIEPKLEAFHRAISNNKHVRSVAYRSANKGPYLATMQSGDFSRIRITDKKVVLASGKELKQIDASGVSAELAWKSDVPYINVEQLGGITAQLPMLEGIASDITSIRIRPGIRSDFKNSVSSLLGLEGQYFTHAVFGRFADTHLGLAEALGISPFEEIASITSEQDKTTFLLFMMQSIVPIAQHIETTLNYLPSFASGVDAEFLGGSDLREHLNIRNNELAYQRALQPIGGLLSHLYKIDGAASRLISLRKQLLAQEGGWGKFLPLGISAAASLINPFALVATAQQGFSLMSRGDTQAALEKDTQADVFDVCAKEWDYLIYTLLPAVAYRVAQDIYPIRLNLSGLLLGAYEKADDSAKEKLVNSVAARYAHVETFKKFPASSAQNIPRQSGIDFLFELQKDAEAFQFRHF